MKFIRAFVASCAALLAASVVQMETLRAEGFYQGKSVELIVSEAVGGSSDAAARLVARHVGRHLPGTPGIVVRNMPGAGGMAAANAFYNVSPRNGLHIALIEQSIYAAQLFKTPGLLADARQLNWLGRVFSNNAVLVAWHTSPVKAIGDVFKSELTVATPGLSSQMRWNMMKKLLGMKLNLIQGFQGTAASMLAMERGEVDAYSAPWMTFRVSQADWLREKKVSVLLQSNLERAADLQDTPRYIDLAANEDQRRIVEVYSRPDQVGRSFAAPPGTPTERLSELRAAFIEMFQSPEFLADAKSMQLTLDPLPGEALQRIVETFFETPRDLIERAETMARP